METISTKDYSIFKKHECNRPIDKSNLNRIKASIESRNLLEFRPILVDEDMCVIDGQHRLEAAKELGCEIFYQFDKKATSTDILLLNLNQKVWKNQDYLSYFISIGNAEYKKFYGFMQQHNMDLHMALVLLYGNGGWGAKIFRNGALKFPTGEALSALEKAVMRFADVRDLIKHKVPDGPKMTVSPRFVSALVSLLKRDDIDFERLKNAISLHSFRIHRCVDEQSYELMLKEIYNWRLHNKIE